MNNRGMKLLSVYWFVILIIVAVGIYAMIYVYYSHPTDVREWEAEILANRVADCISQKARLNEQLFKEEGFNEDFQKNFLSICDLKLDATTHDKTQYYVEVNFYKPDNLNAFVFSISGGLPEWKAAYEGIITKKAAERNVLGIKRRFYSLDNKNNQYLIEILSIVRKTEQNVKI